MKKRWGYLFWWIAVIGCAGIIFFFSAQIGEESSATSNSIALFVRRVFFPHYDELSSLDRLALDHSIHLYTRKAAHFSEFAILGLALRLLLNFHFIPLRSFFAWLLGTLYALTDEWHQMSVPHRNASWNDVLIDSAGVLVGVLLGLLIWKRWEKRRKRKKLDSA